jgi:hypothetical protein
MQRSRLRIMREAMRLRFRASACAPVVHEKLSLSVCSRHSARLSSLPRVIEPGRAWNSNMAQADSAATADHHIPHVACIRAP